MDGVPPELMAKLDLLGIRLHVMRGRSTERFDRPPTKDTWYAYYVDAGLIRYKQKGYHNVPIVGHTALELVKKVLENLNASK